MLNLDQHYQILGIHSGASVEEVRKAYRKKSLQVHPDVNKHPDATAQFVQLNESYEYLIHALTNKIFLSSRGDFVSRKKETTPMSYEEWKNKCREESHKRAYKQAQEHLNKFKKSPYYRASHQIGKILLYSVVGAIYFFTVGIPLLTMIFGSFFAGLFLLLLINFVCLGLHRQVYDTLKEYNRENRYIRRVNDDLMRK